MNEKELLNRLKDSMNEVTPPASLQPDAIEKMLNAQQKRERQSENQEKAADTVNIENTGSQATRKRRRNSGSGLPLLTRCGSMAAVFALAVTAFWQSYRIQDLNNEVETAHREIEMMDVLLEDYQKQETEAADTALQTDLSAESMQQENTVVTVSEQSESAAESIQQENTVVTASEQTEAAASDTSGAEQSAKPDTSASATEPSADSGSSFSGTESLAESGTSALGTKPSTESGSSSSGIISKQTEDTLIYADSYESIYNALRENFYYEYDYVYDSAEYEYEEATVDIAATADRGMGGTMLYSASGSTRSNSKVTSESGSKDFSETNKQETGVDEADIVKTDGDYIYILRTDGSIAILKADGAASEAVSITALPNQENVSVKELYLDGNTLNVLTSETITDLNHEEDIYYTSTIWQTAVYTYDITDRSAPVLKGTVTQEGDYSDSRKVGDHLYLFTRYYPDVCGTYEESTIIPRLNGKQAEASAFYLPDHLDSNTYLVISSLDITSPTDILDSKILISGASQFYVSTENIYIANTSWSTSASSERTEITKFHYEDGTITGVAAGNVDGYLNDSFSLNEYNGNLRVVTTYYAGSVQGDEEIYDEYNGLFIFDEAMKQIGSIRDLAQGETIRSARFFGNTGYFVTFRQTDPLFSVDLSDPTNPVILGELKISGFSSYLHFYGEDLLLGLGYEADEDTGVTTGLKLSMFDISDPSNVTEKHRFLISGITWCPAIEDYKSILVDPEKNLIGFYCDNRYLTFSYDPENGFAQELVYDFYSDMLTGEAEYDSMRGLFIENTLYLAGNRFLISFDMNDAFAKTGLLRFE